MYRRSAIAFFEKRVQVAQSFFRVIYRTQRQTMKIQIFTKYVIARTSSPTCVVKRTLPKDYMHRYFVADFPSLLKLRRMIDSPVNLLLL